MFLKIKIVYDTQNNGSFKTASQNLAKYKIVSFEDSESG